ncbi:unnamed protein product [Anisakis simplex]|uniref:CDT1 domain-containing protein n=1 Tax=Anisakis simplex TaxID=6269 RepID=A0A0M3JUU9_ANISI|nr:unnamed protein product [Anisakis simplex]
MVFKSNCVFVITLTARIYTEKREVKLYEKTKMFLVRKKENKDDGKENNRKGVKGGISKAPLIPPKNVHSATVRSGAQSSLRLCSSSVTIKSSSEALSSHPDKPITQNVELSSNDYSQNELFNTSNSNDSVSSVQQQNIIPSVDVSFPRSSDDHLPLSSVSHDNYHQTSTFHTFPLLKDLPKLSLPALAPVQVNERTLRLQRNFTELILSRLKDWLTKYTCCSDKDELKVILDSTYVEHSTLTCAVV